MAQLVGQACIVCGERIRSIMDSGFCEDCGNPIHNGCIVVSDVELSSTRCARCSGDPDSAIAITVREERRAEAEAARARAEAERKEELRRRGYPESKTCPNCGSKEYEPVETTKAIAFQHDRVCAKCKTRYTVPTPIWAAVLFILIGAAFIVAAVLDLLQFSAEMTAGTLHPARLASTTIVIGLAVGGGFAIRFGIRCLQRLGAR